MASRYAPTAPMLIEPVPVPDTFVTDIVAIEEQHAFIRMTFCADRNELLGDDQKLTERVIVARLIMSLPDFHSMLSQCIRYGRAKPSPDILLHA